MTTPLSDLIAKASPLPWTWDGANLVSSKPTKGFGETVATNPRSGTDVAWIKQGELSLILAAHCCNTYGQLVEALQGLLNPDKSTYGWELKAKSKAEKALATALNPK